MKKRLSIFPNGSQNGMYDSVGQYITINNINQRQFIHLVNNISDQTTIDVAKTLIHEINHYFDDIGTLNGIRTAIKKYNAFNSLYEPTQTEANMHFVVEYYNHLQNMRYDNYYHKIDNEVTDSERGNWAITQSIGLRYDSEGYVSDKKPLIFNRFSNRSRHCARIPYSIHSMWECSSVAKENEIHRQMILNLNQDESLVEESILKRDLNNYVFSTDRLIYSNLVHPIASDIIVNGNLLSAYTVVRKIAALCLNLPQSMYSKVKIPYYVRQYFNPKHIKAFEESRDINYIFFCIYKNLEENGIFYVEDDIDFNDKVLFYSGLPNKVILLEVILQEIEDESKLLSEGQYSVICEETLNKGVDILKMRGIFNDMDMKSLDVSLICGLPVVLKKDGAYTYLNIDEERVEEVFELECRIEEFAKACGY